MNLGDPELEVIDPTPNIHNLFIHFDELFFCTRLASRAVVRWSKKMYSCAGVCSYEGRGGLCNIALSEPLLKLRPRKNLVETLLHEMIHAYLFITCRDNDRDGHGPNFQAHMHRINKSAGINITIYHDFHEEVELYLTHVWRCSGPCQQRRPHFGIVRRTNNKAPGPTDYWWENHKRNCGGTFIKINEPNKPAKKTSKKVPPKPNADIKRYINTTNNVPKKVPAKPVLKDSNILPVKTKSNGGNTLVIPKKGTVINPKVVSNKSPVLFSGKGQPLADVRPRSNSVGVVETVRNIWENKQLSANPTAVINNKQVTVANKIINSTINATNKTPKHKINTKNDSPPAKIKRIDDYFKNTAESVLKDVYGKDFRITQSDKSQKLVAVDNLPRLNRKSTGSDIRTFVNKPSTSNARHVPIEINPKSQSINAIIPKNLVDCPVCSAKVSCDNINRHLDECLNKEVIETLNKDNQIDTVSILPSTSSQSTNNLKQMIGVIPTIPAFSVKISDNIKNEMIVAKESLNVTPPVSDLLSSTKIEEELNTAIIAFEKDIEKESKDSKAFDPHDINKVKAIIKKINFDKLVQESSNFMVPKEKHNNVDFGYLPSFLDEVAHKIENPKIKIEPGSSRDIDSVLGLKCACCGNKMDKPLDEHLDECLAFLANNNTVPNEGASTSIANETIVIDDDDDDIFDDSQIFNATGTKTPCPCCLTMVEESEMNKHLDQCLLSA